MHRPFALPGAGPRYAPDRLYDIRHQKLEIELDFERRSIAGTATLSVAPLAPDARHLVLDAVEMEIVSVAVAGAPATFDYDGAKLRIRMPAQTPPPSDIEVRIGYQATPRRGLYFIAPEPAYPDKPRQVWSQGQDEDSRFWFPCFDAPHEKATSELIVTVPEGMVAISNGRLIERRGGRFHFRMDVPHSPYLVALVAGELIELRDQWEDIELFYYVSPGREDDAQRALGGTPAMMGFFSRYLGVRYPYPTYRQVCVHDFIFGGMENITATTLTADTLHDARAHIDFTSDPLVAHELAHQWFGDLLTCRDWSEGWLNEGFATYLQALWTEESLGASEFDLERAERIEAYLREDAERYRRPIVTRVWEEPIEIFDRHLYDKGAAVLHMLRRRLGEDGFRAALRHYLEKHRAGVVETRDLARAIEEVTGRNCDRFFDQWVYGAGFPDLRVHVEWDDDFGGMRVEIVQTQGDPPSFEIETAALAEIDGEWRRIPLALREPRHLFHLPLDGRPTGFVLDPGRDLLARWDIEKPAGLWRRELSSAPRAIDRAAAAAGVAKESSPQAVRALGEALREDAFWGVRAACARALGSLRTDAARDALVAALAAEEHARARRAVARALGEFRGDLAAAAAAPATAPAAAALERLARAGDPSYYVEAEAVLALCRTRAPQALEMARAALERPSHVDIIRQLACQGLGELREPDERRADAIALLRAQTAYGRPPNSRREAATALGKLGEGRPEARETLEDLLADPEFRVRLAAAGALGTLGDARALSALDAALPRELDGRVRRRIKEVARDLRAGRTREDALRALRDDLDRLRAEHAQLRSQLDKLEARLTK
ncbi:MAG TPA: M1 family aminopeptidase [Polyangia bacterium]|nr:M1 family aminopeptidase [Polyangia bacterium]